MLKQCKGMAVVVCLMFLGGILIENAVAKPPRGGSRRPSFSRPSSRSKPRPSTSRPRPSTSRPTSSSKPKANSGSKKPSNTTSSKARANQKASSKRKYQETKKATSPPRASYKNAQGKTVNVRKNSSAVTRMRSRPSSYYTPAARTTRHTTYITTHNYSHGYGWYHSQPHFYVGGGYSSVFWYMMGDWSAQRRATWFYHNRANIESSAYQRGMQDAQVSAAYNQMQISGVKVNGDYVDPEMADNPGMQYSQDYVEAAYNPTVVVSDGGGSAAGTAFVWILVIGFGFLVVWAVSTKLKWGN